MSSEIEISQHQRLTPFFRASARFEGVTLILLMCVAVPLKNLTSLPILTGVVGPFHGLAFLLFLYAVVESWAAGDLPLRWVPAALSACLLPGGTFALLHFYNRRRTRQQLEKKQNV